MRRLVWKFESIAFVLFCLISGSFGLKKPYHTTPEDQKEAYEDLLTGDYEIFKPEEFEKNELCKVLRCHEDEVCLVKHNSAVCFPKTKLQFDDDFRSHRKKSHRRREDVRRVRAKHWERFNEKTRLVEKWDEYQRQLKAENEYLPENVKVHRHRPEIKENAACSDAELRAMGKRLLSWFGSIHSQHSQDAKAIPRHHVSCDQEVAWMFTELDGNNDANLDENELNSVENDPYEICLRPFLDRCDQDANDLIKLDEWCDCFTYAGKEKDEPPCHAIRHQKDPHLLGSFLPKCDVDGFYETHQCHENFCWCVDRLGREFPGSKVQGRQADCGQYDDKGNDEF